jgi:hypothetical protein
LFRTPKLAVTVRYVVLVLLACGCASSGNTAETIVQKPPTIYAGDQSMATIIGEKPRASMATIAAAPAAVWMAAKQVYASIDVPLGIENATAHILGNQNFYKARQMAGQPMTQFVDCGAGMTGQKAASYRIYMSLVTDISADGKGGTLVQTTFTALGQDVTEGSSDRIPCGTTGRLEQLVLDKIKVAVATR